MTASVINIDLDKTTEVSDDDLRFEDVVLLDEEVKK